MNIETDFEITLTLTRWIIYLENDKWILRKKLKAKQPLTCIVQWWYRHQLVQAKSSFVLLLFLSVITFQQKELKYLYPQLSENRHPKVFWRTNNMIGVALKMQYFWAHTKVFVFSCFFFFLFCLYWSLCCIHKGSRETVIYISELLWSGI